MYWEANLAFLKEGQRPTNNYHLNNFGRSIPNAPQNVLVSEEDFFFLMFFCLFFFTTYDSDGDHLG